MIDHSVNDWNKCKTGMLMRLWILGITAAVVSSELSGDHVCEFEESYPVNVTEYTWRNVTVRNYKWCMGFPPRCSFYTFKSVKVPQITEVFEKRKLKKCCPGYAADKTQKTCLPCSKCYEGTCGNEGKCVCNPGFRGEDCSNACESMHWGTNCSYDCLCERGTCEPRTGRCECPSGWFGTRCELLCLEGFYGKHCINRCNCGERDLCNPETGECLQKRTRQEHYTTRAIHYMTGNVLNITNILDKHHTSPSLKKYHTFDMEINTTQPIHTKTTQKSVQPITKPSQPTIPTEKHMEEKEESIESTTEMSAEILYNENVPIINDNGSLEKKDSGENFNVLDKVELPNVFPGKGLFNKSSSEVIVENTTKISHKSTGNWQNTSSVIGDIANSTSQNKNVSKITMQTNNNGTPTTPTIIAVTTRKNIGTRAPKLLNHHLVYTSSSLPTHDYTQMDKSFTESSRGIIETKEGTNIPSTVENTPPIDRIDHENNRQIIEEEYLQNLDDLNVLTSKETTTSYAPLTTTQKTITFLKEGILPITELKTSTKSFGENIGNDLSTSDSTENRKPLKEAYDLPRGKEGNYLRDQASSGEFEYSTNEKNNLPTQMAIAGIVSFILVLIMSAGMLVHNYAQKRKKKDPKLKIEHHQTYPGGPRVSVYAHSIFHTPLPDPPTFENPIFAAPTDNSMDNRTFQTHVVCSLNISGHQRPDDKEYTYDHPPSTGSYRAASIPEPPDMNDPVTTEPLYDEIPSNGRLNAASPPPSYKSSCIYMNTCGKTKF